MNISDVYKNYYRHIYNYALKLTCHPEDALDVTQDTFLKAMEKLDTLENEPALAGWLRVICFHEFINKTKREPNKYFTEPIDWATLENEGSLFLNPPVQPEDEIVVQEEIKDLQNGCFLAMVRKLTLHQRIVFSLSDMYGLPIDFIADLLGITQGAAKGLLYRARMNIDSFFSDHCSILYESNPCSCKAWITFSTNRSNLQKQTKRLIERLDYNHKQYKYNSDVRKKVQYLYGHMPEQKPDDEWYSKVLLILSDLEK